LRSHVFVVTDTLFVHPLLIINRLTSNEHGAVAVSTLGSGPQH